MREYRLSAPNSEAGTKLPIVAAFHGGGGAGYPFPQEVEFDQLGKLASTTWCPIWSRTWVGLS